MEPKEEVSDIVLKSIGYFLLGAVILFALFYVSVRIIFYFNSLPDIYYSDSKPKQFDINERYKLISSMESKLDSVFKSDVSLKDMHGLYYGGGPGPLFKSSFISFQTDSKEECENLFQNEERFALKNFQKGDFSLDGPWQYYHLPHTWSKRYQDPNWPLKEGDEFLYCGDYQELILYTPEDNKVYICIDNGP